MIINVKSHRRRRASGFWALAMHLWQMLAASEWGWVLWNPLIKCDHCRINRHRQGNRHVEAFRNGRRMPNIQMIFSVCGWGWLVGFKTAADGSLVRNPKGSRRACSRVWHFGRVQLREKT